MLHYDKDTQSDPDLSTDLLTNTSGGERLNSGETWMSE